MGYTHHDKISAVNGFAVGEAGNEKVVIDGDGNFAQNYYGEGWFANNAIPIGIETINTPHAIYGVVGAGLCSGTTFDVGDSGAISAFADYGGTVAGAVAVISAGHGLITGNIITITGSTNYNGVFCVTYIDANTFYVIDTWVANDGASTWTRPSSLTVDAQALTRVYVLSAHISISPAVTCQAIWTPYVGTTPQSKGVLKQNYWQDAGGEYLVSGAFTLLLELSAGDIIWMSIQSDTLTNLVPPAGGMRLWSI